LNHLITEMLPGEAGINADPITGQAAWYDLRVRVEKAVAAEEGFSAPGFATLHRLPSMMPPPDIVRYGAHEQHREAAE
jgi:sulfite dehydrogenase (quinone) subunit SoeA